MRKLTLLLAMLLIGISCTTAQTWTQLALDDAADALDPKKMEGKALHYYYDEATDSIFFKIDVVKAKAENFNLNVALAVEGAGKLDGWFGVNKSQYNRVITVWTTNKTATYWEGTIGVADVDGTSTSNWNNLHQDNINIQVNLSGNYYVLGLPRQHIYTGKDLKANIFGACGADGAWVDDIPNTGAAHVEIIGKGGPKTLEIFSPDENTVWEAKQSKVISWISNGVNNIKIEYNTDMSDNWILSEEAVPASAGSYSWTVPNTPSTTFRIKLSDAADTAINDVSPAFTVTQNSSIFNISMGSSMKVYPVPSSGRVTLELEQEALHTGGKVSVYSMMGQEVYTQKLDNYNSTTMPLDLTTLPDGNYILMLYSEKYTGRSRITITH